ncbi:MAG: NUDIX domain-containing protein [Asticcacaulis sp.]
MQAPLRQFGHRLEGLDYQPREAAYGFLLRDGYLAIAQIGYTKFSYDFPGGALDDGETPEMAVEREFAEETGLMVRVVEPVGEVLNYFVHQDGTPYNNHCRFYEMEWVAEQPELKSEADHELVWMRPFEAMKRVKHPAYAWALLLWLRERG